MKTEDETELRSLRSEQEHIHRLVRRVDERLDALNERLLPKPQASAEPKWAPSGPIVSSATNAEQAARPATVGEWVLPAQTPKPTDGDARRTPNAAAVPPPLPSRPPAGK